MFSRIITSTLILLISILVLYSINKPKSIDMASTASQRISRTIVKKVLAVQTPEGKGALVRRSIGSMSLRNLTPFLMLDHFDTGSSGSFPVHPHRGMTTVTYMIQGSFEHEDFLGHHGVISPGDMQWMSANRGILHAEMPVHEDPKTGAKLPDPVGLQLWLDVPTINKKDPPTYQEYRSDQLPVATPRADQPEELEGKGWKVKVLSGSSHGVTSPVKTPPSGACSYFDIHLSPGGKFWQDLPPSFCSFIYILSGKIQVGSKAEEHEKYHTLVLSDSGSKTNASTEGEANGVWIENKSQEEARFILVAGEKLDQEVHQYGPFVLSSREDVQQTLIDYQRGINGFEGAHEWQSKISGRA